MWMSRTQTCFSCTRMLVAWSATTLQERTHWQRHTQGRTEWALRASSMLLMSRGPAHLQLRQGVLELEAEIIVAVAATHIIPVAAALLLALLRGVHCSLGRLSRQLLTSCCQLRLRHMQRHGRIRGRCGPAGRLLCSDRVLRLIGC